jgi:hypothetical protein
VDRLTGMLIRPIVVGLGAVGPEDPDQAHRNTVTPVPAGACDTTPCAADRQ